MESVIPLELHYYSLEANNWESFHQIRSHLLLANPIHRLKAIREVLGFLQRHSARWRWASLFITSTSIQSRKLKHLFVVMHLRCLFRILNHDGCNYLCITRLYLTTSGLMLHSVNLIPANCGFKFAPITTLKL